MGKFNWENGTIKTMCVKIICLFCVLTVGMVITQLINCVNAPKSVISTEISNIKSMEKPDGDNISNYKVEIVNYDMLSYYIKVNCKEQIVIVYTADENGVFNIPVKTMVCSTGAATPSKGTYKISDKYKWRYLVGNVYGQYATRITGQILFHSVPYKKMTKDSLEYWEYDKLGKPASKGCVRLSVEDAKWIYDYCNKGTVVEFCTDELSAAEKENVKLSKKISKYDEKLRNWDPTDPDKNNPWLKYIEK